MEYNTFPNFSGVDQERTVKAVTEDELEFVSETPPTGGASAFRLRREKEQNVHQGQPDLPAKLRNVASGTLPTAAGNCTMAAHAGESDPVQGVTEEALTGNLGS